MKLQTTILLMALGASSFSQVMRPSSLSTAQSDVWSLGGNTLGPYGANTNNSVLTKGIVITSLLAPVVIATKYGATGSTTWQYKVSAITGALETDAGSAQITNGATSLTTSNYVRLTWPLVTGATSYKVYRYIGGGIAQYRYIKTVYGGSYSDTGVDAYTTATPSLVNQTGKITGATISGNADTATTAVGLSAQGGTRTISYNSEAGGWDVPEGINGVATTATKLGTSTLGIPKITNGTPSSATGADIAALITSTNIATTGTISSPSIDGENNPASHSFLGWTYRPDMVGATSACTSGRLYLMKIWVPVNIHVTNVNMVITVLPTTAQGNFNGVGLYTSAGALIGATAEQYASWAAGSTYTLRTMAISGGAVDIVGGPGIYIYAGVMATSTGLPAFEAATLSDIVNVNQNVTNTTYGYISTLTALPANITTPTGMTLTPSGKRFWIALS